jgi:hypothetical protein
MHFAPVAQLLPVYQEIKRNAIIILHIVQIIQKSYALIAIAFIVYQVMD